jgi:predicted ATP-grasp superfamily ATP-dependent carboligase
VGVGVSVLANAGRVIQAFQHRRLREGRSGSSSRISEPVNRDLLKACQSICRHTNLTGICMFEFRYKVAAQDWVLLEANARFWGSLPLPLSLGVDFPRLLYDLLVSKTEHPQRVYPAGIRARNFALDGRNLVAEITRLRVHNVGSWLSNIADFLAQPLRWVAGTERSDTFVGDDLKPALAECAGLVRSAAPRIAAVLRSQHKPVERQPHQHRQSLPHLGTQ